MDVIIASLQDYLDVNGAYPCPSSLTAALDTTGFGVAIAGTGVDTDTDPIDSNCQGATEPAGTNRVTGVRNYTPPVGSAYQLNVRVGAVPVRTLNLPDEYAADGWSGRFTYAVTEQLTDARSTGGFFQNSGGIEIIDSAGNSVVQPVKTAHYALISHGPDRSGSNEFDTGDAYDGGACTGTDWDNENCPDTNAKFRKTSLIGNPQGTAHYDDIVNFGAQTDSVELIPEGVILPFDIAASNGDIATATSGSANDPCPPGWSRYDALRGKVIKGATGAGSFTYGASPTIASVTLSSLTVPAHAHTIPGQTKTQALAIGGPQTITYLAPIGETVPVTIPAAGNINTGTWGNTGTLPTLNTRDAYVALLYCRKD